MLNEFISEADEIFDTKARDQRNRDTLITFIKNKFQEYTWKKANKYGYWQTSFPRFDTYREFLNFQKQCILEKSSSELEWLIDVRNNLDSIKIMKSDSMFPVNTVCFVFDTESKIILINM